MSKNLVAIVSYEKPQEFVQKAVELSRGLDHLPANAKVYIKPNIVRPRLRQDIELCFTKLYFSITRTTTI